MSHKMNQKEHRYTMTVLISFLIIFVIISSNIAIKIAKKHEQQVAHRDFLIAEVYEKSIALKEIKQLNHRYGNFTSYNGRLRRYRQVA
jgi:hypothetical protein